MTLGFSTAMTAFNLFQKATGEVSNEMGGGETSAQKRARIESRVDMSDAKRTVYDRVDMKAGEVKASEAVSYKDYLQGWNNFLDNTFTRLANDQSGNPQFKKRKTVKEVGDE